MPRNAQNRYLSGTMISDWMYIRTRLIWVTQREVEPMFLDNEYVPRKAVVAWLIKRGKASVKVGDREASACEGQWMFPGYGEGWQKISPGSIILSIWFWLEWPTGEQLFPHNESIVLPSETYRKLTRTAEVLMRLVHRVSGRQGHFYLDPNIATLESYFAIRRAFDNWLSAYVGTMLKLGQKETIMALTDPRILQATRLIDSHPAHLPLTDGELARSIGLSASQLNRLFLRDLRTTPKKYMERRRMENAVLLLHVHKRSVKEVAYELGFSSPPHFSAWFRRQQGLSPREFQQGESQ